MVIGRDGCSGYRVKNPLNAIKNVSEHKVHFIDHGDSDAEIADLIQGADVICFRQQHDQFFRYLKKRGFLDGKLAVADMDDDIFNITPFADTYRWGGVEEVQWEDKWLWQNGKDGFDAVRNRNNLQSVVDMLSQADVVTCTTPYLAERLREISGCAIIEVVPNAIDFNHWKDWKIKKDKEIRIGWTGGSTHYIDWYTIKDGLQTLFKRNKDIKLVLQGCKWDGTIKDIPHEFHNWIDFEGHPYKTASLNLDFAIIPLKDTQFNKSKSCIKWYEFSSLGVPCVISDVAPYNLEAEHDKTALLFKNEDDFVIQCERMIKDAKLRKKIASNAHKWVKENRDLEKIAQNYIDIFNKYDPNNTKS